MPMRVMFEEKSDPTESDDVLSHSEIDRVVAYMRMGTFDMVYAAAGLGSVTAAKGSTTFANIARCQHRGSSGREVPTRTQPRRHVIIGGAGTTPPDACMTSYRHSRSAGEIPSGRNCRVKLQNNTAASLRCS